MDEPDNAIEKKEETRKKTDGGVSRSFGALQFLPPTFAIPKSASCPPANNSAGRRNKSPAGLFSHTLPLLQPQTPGSSHRLRSNHLEPVTCSRSLSFGPFGLHRAWRFPKTARTTLATTVKPANAGFTPHLPCTLELPPILPALTAPSLQPLTGPFSPELTRPP
ncbi:hypothetical protein IAQ61_003221 [Plenodomus lingam]|uniref:uncharacterized protein n=1 Tax=Leptosphaeria maculans TaxID=5022 RepID=UPI00332E4896|nr:hypothetical protein IAQ61_003221 [Plenodomus lingam]